MTVIEDVKQKIDIVELVGQYVKLTKSGRNMRGLCPFHSEKAPSFFVYPEQQSWHCFGSCNTGGDIFSFIMKKEGLSFKDALSLLAEKAGVAVIGKTETETERKERDRLVEANKAAADYYHQFLLHSPQAKKARDYLAHRGVSLDAITSFQLGCSPDDRESLKQHLSDRGYSEKEMLTVGLLFQAEDGKVHDRFRHKIMFPIVDSRSRVTGFGARVLDDSLPKYINSPQTPLFDKSGSLYGINLAHNAIRQQDMVIIVEGYMDVIIAHQYGFTNVVAPMGTAINEKHLAMLRKLTKNMVLALDADKAGKEASLRGVGYENELGAEVRVMVLPAGKDPDEVIKESPDLWKKLLAEAVPVIDYTFDAVIREHDLNSARGKTQVGDKLLPIIGEIKDTIRQGHYLEKLAGVVKVDSRRLQYAMAKLKAAPKGKVKEEKTVSRRQALGSSKAEEYCLALLLQHPELKEQCENLKPEYFTASENREIYLALLSLQDIKSIKERFDSSMGEYIDSLVNQNIPADSVDKKIADSILRLQEFFLRNLEIKKAAILTLEAETGGSNAALVKLQEQGIDVSVQLGQVFTRRRKDRPGQGGK